MKAFPNVTGEKGMDLRDYFAAKAMQELIHIYVDDPTIENGDPRRAYIAALAYDQADAMMEAREQDGD